MEKKYQIFVSSTYLDLIEERQAAVEAILELGHIPAGMELFNSGKEQMETIKKWIDESDIYMLILGGRYGSIEEESQKSYTHLEYEYALQKKMPIFSIIIDDGELKARVASCLSNNGEINYIQEIENVKKYNEFKKEVSQKIYGNFKEIKDIKIQVFKQVNYIEKEHKLLGWVKKEEVDLEIKKLKEQNHKLAEEIVKASQNEICDRKKKDKCNEELGNIYSKDNMVEKYKEFLEDINEVYILVGDLDFLLDQEGKEQLNLIQGLGEKCNILFRKKDNFSNEIIKLCKDFKSVGVNVKYYSRDVDDNIKNIKGQFKIDSQKRVESLIICKKHDKFRLINFESQYLSEIFMNEVRTLFFEKSEEFLV